MADREVEIEGEVYLFPEEATDEEIASAFQRQQIEGTVYESSKDVPSNLKFYWDDAVSKVEQREGRELSLKERRVVQEEGYVDATYKDTKGIPTVGVGQTNEFRSRTFKDSFDEHEKRAKRLLKNYDNVPEYVQAELMSAMYRGDVVHDYNWVKAFNAGDYRAAGEFFLQHKEYSNPETSSGIKDRLERVQDALFKYADEQQAAEAAIQSVPESPYNPNQSKEQAVKDMFNNMFNKDNKKQETFSF